MPPLYRPSVGAITQPYRSESSPGKPIHLAVDFGYGNGKDVRAAMPGHLRFDKTFGYGLRAIISHPDGSMTKYAHLSSQTEPREVSVGEKIGVMGDTGSLAKGVHLHFELWVNGRRRDPTPYFTTSLPNPEPPPPESEEMTTYELVSATTGNPNGDIYFSVNRLQRYKVPNELTLNDYASWIKDVLGLPPVGTGQLSGVFPFTYVRGISNIHAFGAEIVASGGLTASQNDALMGLPAAIDNMPTNGELSGVITNQYNLLRTGATNDKNEILAAIDEIPGGSAPQNLTVTLTGTAEAAQ